MDQLENKIIMKFTKKQLDRYSRQIILKKVGAIGQKKLLKSSVLIVGAGGLGSPIAIYLAALGVGKIGIVDKDKVELSNLNRQVIFETNDLKKEKSLAAENKLKKINPDISIKSFKILFSTCIYSKINIGSCFELFKKSIKISPS